MASWLRHLVGGAVALGTLLASAPAPANGRFPRAQRLLEDPRDPGHLVLAGTYGLLVTSDRGESWRYVCEAAFGETDLPVDALTALTPQGALLAGIYSGVSRAEREPCDFVRTLGMSNREAVPDFALAAASPGRVLAIMVTLPQQGTPYSRLYRSEDDGQTWEPLGEPLPEALKTPLTIDVAPSDSNRIYLSGLGPDEEGVLLRSDDGGESFESLSIPTDAARFEHPYIAAVAADDADRLYVRTDLWLFDATTGTSRANDALLVSNDGGESFTVAARASGKLLGFVFSPDGSEYLLGFGDPLELGRVTEPESLGIYRASTSGGRLEKIYSGSVGCLSWTEQGLYVCAHESDTGFSLGVSADAALDLQAPLELEPLLKLEDVAGPIECAACSAAAVCQAYWASTCQSWGRSDCVDLRTPRCESEGGAGGTAGFDAEAGTSAVAVAGATSTSGGMPGDADAGAPAGVSEGCACRGSSAPVSVAALWSLSVLLGVGRLRRRR